MNHNANKIHNVKIFAGRSILLAFILTAVCGLLLTLQTVPAQSKSIQSIVTIPPTLKPLNSPEVFGPDTLYEKINGQAELYLAAGFVRLKSQWFGEAEDAASMFEVYIYHMSDPLSAFSVFSVQRTEDVQTSDVAPFAYTTENSLYLLHGPYYVEMISAVSSEKLLSQMASLARNFIKDTPVDMTSIDGLRLFPKKNLDQDSITLIAQDAFGFDRLDRVYTATYNIDGGKVTAFISKRKTPREAKDIARGLHTYFITFGGKDIKPDLQIKDAKMIEIMGTFDIVFALDTYLAGVHEVSGKTQAEKVANVIAQSLREMHGIK